MPPFPFPAASRAALRRQAMQEHTRASALQEAWRPLCAHTAEQCAHDAGALSACVALLETAALAPAAIAAMAELIQTVAELNAERED